MPDTNYLLARFWGTQTPRKNCKNPEKSTLRPAGPAHQNAPATPLGPPSLPSDLDASRAGESSFARPAAPAPAFQITPVSRGRDLPEPGDPPAADPGRNCQPGVTRSNDRRLAIPTEQPLANVGPDPRPGMPIWYAGTKDEKRQIHELLGNARAVKANT